MPLAAAEKLEVLTVQLVVAVERVTYESEVLVWMTESLSPAAVEAAVERVMEETADIQMDLQVLEMQEHITDIPAVEELLVLAELQAQICLIVGIPPLP